MSKFAVDIEYITFIKNELARINEYEFDDITWVKGGEILPMTKRVREDWSFTGLTNTDFATTGEYKKLLGGGKIEEKSNA